MPTLQLKSSLSADASMELGLISPGTPELDAFARPELPNIAGQTTRAGQLTLEGASYRAPSKFVATKLIFRITGVSGLGVMRVAIYQSQQLGVAGINPTLIATATTTAGAQDNQELSVPAFQLNQGMFYILFGKVSGTSVTMRVFGNANVDLLTANVQLNTHPFAFTSVISSTIAPPATITTSMLLPTTLDTIPVFRFRA